MQKFHHLRALALLGALILYFFLWPICCCAARPTWSPSVTDISMQISANGGGSLKSNLTLSNQTYRYLMTATGISDNMGTNDKIVDLFNASSGTYSRSDKGTAVHNDQPDENVYEIINNRQESAISGGGESATNSDSLTTSIYELFDLRKRKRKFVSSNQVLSRTDRSVYLNSSNSKNNSVSGAKRVKNKSKSSTLERNERSANLSHITGSARKIQLYIKNRFLQLLPDGTINGTTDDLSDFSKLRFSLFIPYQFTNIGACKRLCWKFSTQLDEQC